MSRECGLIIKWLSIQQTAKVLQTVRHGIGSGELEFHFEGLGELSIFAQMPAYGCQTRLVHFWLRYVCIMVEVVRLNERVHV